jgi:hypothetical protein
MRKQTIEYEPPIDALIVVAKRLSVYEDRYKIVSEDFYYKFCKGKIEDSIDFTEWSNDYQHYLTMKLKLEKQLQHVAL